MKRNNPIIEAFDASSEHEPYVTPWPDDESLEADELTELDAAEVSLVPTPRPDWAPVDAGSTPLPIVTAKSEPTQRGLGIPPPPSSDEAPWFSQIPSLGSVAPLSLDAFEEGEPAKASPTPLEPPLEQTENERITVRAASGRGTGARRRFRRGVAIAFLGGAALALGVASRRATSRAGHDGIASPVSAAMPRPGAPVLAPAAPVIAGSTPDRAIRAAREAVPLPAPSSVGDEERGVENATRTSRPPKEMRQERRRRLKLERARNRTAATAPVAVGAASLPSIGDESIPSDPHPALTLPPR